MTDKETSHSQRIEAYMELKKAFNDHFDKLMEIKNKLDCNDENQVPIDNADPIIYFDIDTVKFPDLEYHENESRYFWIEERHNRVCNGGPLYIDEDYR